MNKNVLIGGALVLAYFLFRKKRINTNAKLNESANIVYNEILNAGYDNPYTVAAMLATIERESNFKPQTEISYKNTSNYRIRNIFKTRLGSKTDTELNALKANDVNFFGAVYGGSYGNNTSVDGYKYRGRGFNQITFKNIYKNVGDKIGVDLVNNPDLLNKTNIAARAFIAYMEIALQDARNSGKWDANFSHSLNKAQSQEEANKMMLKLNAGWKVGYSSESYKFLTNRSPFFYELITD